MKAMTTHYEEMQELEIAVAMEVNWTKVESPWETMSNRLRLHLVVLKMEWEMDPEVIVGIEAKVDTEEIQTHTNVERILRNLILHHCSLQFHLTLLVNLLFRL